MAKMSKKVKSLILAAIILVVLGGILTLLLLLPNDSDSADSSSAGATSSDASIVLIDKEQKNVKNINIKTQNESYDIASVGDKKWEIAALKGFDQLDTMYTSVTTAAADISATKILLDKQENLAEYGLDKPATVVTVTYTDGTVFKMNLGSETPDASGRYMTVDGKDPIYIYDSYSASSFENAPYDYLDPTILNLGTDSTSSTSSSATSSGEKEAVIIERFEIQRKDLDKPLIFQKLENNSDDSTGISLGTYQITSPLSVTADDEKLGTNLTGFLTLSGSSVEVLKPSAAEKKARGFQNPTAVIKVKYDGKDYTLRVGNAITCEAEEDKDSLESGHTHTITGYNVMLDGKDLIYNVSSSSLPWLTMEAKDYMSVFVVIPNIVDVKTVTVTIGSNKYVFNLSTKKDEDDNDIIVPKYNGTTLTEDYFKSYYQVLLGIYQAGLNTKKVSGSPVMTLQYDYHDSSRKSDKLEYYDNGAGAIIISLNGNANFTARYSTVKKAMEDTLLIIQNKEVDAN